MLGRAFSNTHGDTRSNMVAALLGDVHAMRMQHDAGVAKKRNDRYRSQPNKCCMQDCDTTTAYQAYKWTPAS
jgi:hypothetical protein